MTGIAARANDEKVEIACDSYSELCGMSVTLENPKIGNYNDYILYGIAGDACHCATFPAFLAEEKPEITITEVEILRLLRAYKVWLTARFIELDVGESCSFILLIDNYGDIGLAATKHSASIFQNYATIGVVDDYMLGCLDCGKTATEAVQMACDSIFYRCHEPVYSLSLPRKKRDNQPLLKVPPRILTTSTFTNESCQSKSDSINQSDLEVLISSQ